MKKIIFDTEAQVGSCPKCKSVNLQYETIIVDTDSAYYPFTCNSCGISGKEWYSLNFVETTFEEK